jgi:GABA permease
MQNPIRSEAEAYRLVLLTALAFAAVVAVSLFGGFLLGVATWALLTGAAAFFYLRAGRRRRPVQTAPPHRGAPEERRVLVLANRVLDDGAQVAESLVEEIQESTAGYRARVNLVYPLPVSTIRHWASDVDSAAARAESLLNDAIAVLRAHGLEARGEVGDDDPLQAIEDSLRTFGADTIVVVTHEEPHGHELDRTVVARARERFALPITHLVVSNLRATARV